MEIEKDENAVLIFLCIYKTFYPQYIRKPICCGFIVNAYFWL